MADRYCGNCGHELRADDRFCPSCGRPVHAVALVPTPEADVPVPRPPRQTVWDDTSKRTKQLIGLLVLSALILSLLLANAGNDGGGRRADQGGGSADTPSPAPAPEGSNETFTSENYPELVSDPEAHEGAEVNITGQIFTAPELVEGDTAFQMFADPQNSEWNTAVYVEGSDTDLEVDDYVNVVGTVEGEMEGENMMRGTVTAVMLRADEVDVVSAVEAVDPTQEIVEVGRTVSDQGFSIKLKKIEFGEDTTRVYVSVYNGTGAGASFSDYDAKILQGSRQFDQETTFDYEVKAPQTDLRPGVRTDGVVTFGKVDPSQPLEVRFEWYSDNYNITAYPIVFQVKP